MSKKSDNKKDITDLNDKIYIDLIFDLMENRTYEYVDGKKIKLKL